MYLHKTKLHNRITVCKINVIFGAFGIAFSCFLFHLLISPVEMNTCYSFYRYCGLPINFHLPIHRKLLFPLVKHHFLFK
jgi:hypothetical protein